MQVQTVVQKMRDAVAGLGTYSQKPKWLLLKRKREAAALDEIGTEGRPAADSSDSGDEAAAAAADDSNCDTEKEHSMPTRSAGDVVDGLPAILEELKGVIDKIGATNSDFLRQWKLTTATMEADNGWVCPAIVDSMVGPSSAVAAMAPAGRSGSGGDGAGQAGEALPTVAAVPEPGSFGRQPLSRSASNAGVSAYGPNPFVQFLQSKDTHASRFGFTAGPLPSLPRAAGINTAFGSSAAFGTPAASS